MFRFACFTLAVLITLPTLGAVLPENEVQSLLDRGQIEQAEAKLVAKLNADAEDHDARLALGTVRMLKAIQGLTADYYKYGPQQMNLPMFRLPMPQNDNPEPITHKQLQEIFDRFAQRLAEVDQALEPIGDTQVKWVVRLDTIRLDFDGNGKAEGDEMLSFVLDELTGGSVSRAINQGRRENAGADAVADVAGDGGEQEMNAFVLALDTTDAYWMRAYTHLLRGFVHTVRAHDTSELFNRVGHLLFAKPDTPYKFLQRGGQEEQSEIALIADYVALVHLINLPVQSPDRLKSALEHFETTVALSRKMWAAAQAETDNDREWLPAPKQDSVIPARIDEDRLAAWMSLLDETEAVLAGEKLIPFWRNNGGEPIGVNLRRAFIEPQRMDLVLWVQGTAAAPFLENDKPLTTGDFWGRINQQFGGNLMGFAVFIN